jgi:presenilin-like A22 family membrane protease
MEIIIAVALGLAAIVTAGAVFLNEHQEHKAEQDFHTATHSIVLATGAGVRTPAGHALELRAERFERSAEDHQERAATYTLAEVILATSLFLFGVAGISARWRLKVATLLIASGVFLTALIVLAIADL